MWHPDACASRDVQTVCQGDVMAVANTDLPNAHGWVHPQRFLHKQTNKSYDAHELS